MNVDTNEGLVINILGLEEQTTLLRGSRRVCVIDYRIGNESYSPDDGVLRGLDGAEVARYGKRKRAPIEDISGKLFVIQYPILQE